MKKYPNGRYIEIANNEVLRDDVPGVEINGEWVPYDDDAFPIVDLLIINIRENTREKNEVTHSKGPQNIVNYIWSSILDGFKMQGNPITIVGDAAGIDVDELTTEPGLTVQAADINQIRREPGSPIDGGSV